ncbi:MAG: hypothetical protein HQL65_14585 [Magnetococcales bacterium]|nr:hypothetical protein [Magnetococcales bacterium]
MSTVSTSLQISFSSPEADSSFELVTSDNDQGGAVPVQVTFSSSVVRVSAWGVPPKLLPLEVAVPGRKRVKLYCSKRAANEVKILVDEGPIKIRVTEPASLKRDVLINAATNLGRRSEPVTEVLDFQGETRKRLRWFHDQPQVKIIHQTMFRDRSGSPLEPPIYNPTRGEFFCAGEAYGALAVEYAATFSLFEITYGNGIGMATPEHFRDMQKAWSSGNINSTEIPPVSLLAITDYHVAKATFERVFWPSGTPGVSVKWAGETEKESGEIGDYSERPGTRKNKVRTVPIDMSGTEPKVVLEDTTYIELQDMDTKKIVRYRFLGSR